MFLMRKKDAASAKAEQEAGTDKVSLNSIICAQSVARKWLAKRRIKRLKYRGKVARELLETEKEYVGKLQILVQHYLIPFRNESQKNPRVVRPEDVPRIFSHSEAILNLNKNLLSQLNERVAKWTTWSTALGDVMCGIAPYLKLYTQYIINFTESKAALRRCLQNNRAEALVKTCKAASGTKLGLDSLLIEPVQRIPRYELLLKELIKYTPQEHMDYKDLTSALQAINSVMVHINEQRRDAEGLMTLVKIQESIMGHMENLASVPNRRFLYEGDVTLVLAYSTMRTVRPGPKKNAGGTPKSLQSLFDDPTTPKSSAVDENKNIVLRETKMSDAARTDRTASVGSAVADDPDAPAESSSRKTSTNTTASTVTVTQGQPGAATPKTSSESVVSPVRKGSVEGPGGVAVLDESDDSANAGVIMRARAKWQARRRGKNPDTKAGKVSVDSSRTSAGTTTSATSDARSSVSSSVSEDRLSGSTASQPSKPRGDSGGSAGGSSSTPLHYFLLDDLLLLVERPRVRLPSGRAYVYRHSIKLAHASYRDIASLADMPNLALPNDLDVQMLNQCAFEIAASRTAFVLIASSPADKNQLLADIRKAQLQAIDSSLPKMRGLPPLHRAALCDRADVVIRLLTLGVGVNSRDDAGLTALHHACNDGAANAVSALLSDPDCDPRLRVPTDGLQALHLAASRGHAGVVTALLRSPLVPINGMDGVQRTPLYHAAMAERWGVVRILHSGGADMNIADVTGWSLLHLAAYAGNVHGVHQLLAIGANVMLCNGMGRTALHYACVEQNVDVATALLRYGARPNMRDDSGSTPVYFAQQRSGSREIPILCVLLRYGARPQLRKNETVLDGRGAAEVAQLNEAIAAYTSLVCDDVIDVLAEAESTKDSSACAGCGTDFTLTTWKHHCRLCGANVCDACSTKRLKLRPTLILNGASSPAAQLQPKRVCDSCFNRTLGLREPPHSLSDTSINSDAIVMIAAKAQQQQQHSDRDDIGGSDVTPDTSPNVVPVSAVASPPPPPLTVTPVAAGPVAARGEEWETMLADVKLTARRRVKKNGSVRIK